MLNTTEQLRIRDRIHWTVWGTTYVDDCGVNVNYEGVSRKHITEDLFQVFREELECLLKKNGQKPTGS